MLESWEPGVQMVLVRNPNYFGPPPDIGRIIYRQVPESANRVALLISGDAQIARDLTQDELDTVDQVAGRSRPVHRREPVRLCRPQLRRGHADGRSEGAAGTGLRRAVSGHHRFGLPRARQTALRLRHQTPMPISSGPTRSRTRPTTTRPRRCWPNRPIPNGFDATILVDAGVPEHERIAVLLQDSFAKIGVNLDDR